MFSARYVRKGRLSSEIIDRGCYFIFSDMAKVLQRVAIKENEIVSIK